MSFEYAKQVLEKLKSHGFQAYIVGGYVRDRLLQRPLGDIDIATSALPEDVQRIFPKTIPIGIEHGTVIVRFESISFEITTFRKEGVYVNYRRPSEVQFHDSIEADLTRRDFTINALAMDGESEIIDPFNGQLDIKNKLLKAVGDPSERFKEDPLRMMRGIRFSSTLGFQIEKETLSALNDNASLLGKISIERIRDEFDKLLTGKWCEKALSLLQSTGISVFLPGGPFSLDGDETSYDWNSLQTAEERWAAFLIRTQTAHPKRFLIEWKMSNRMVSKTVQLLELVRSDADFTSTSTLYEHGIEQLEIAIRVKRFIGMESDVRLEDLESQYGKLPIKDRSELAINGDDLQKQLDRKPGPWIAELIERIERNVLAGKIENTREGIKEWIEKCDQTREKS